MSDETAQGKELNFSSPWVYLTEAQERSSGCWRPAFGFLSHEKNTQDCIYLFYSYCVWTFILIFGGITRAEPVPSALRAEEKLPKLHNAFDAHLNSGDQHQEGQSGRVKPFPVPCIIKIVQMVFSSFFLFKMLTNLSTTPPCKASTWVLYTGCKGEGGRVWKDGFNLWCETSA